MESLMRWGIQQCCSHCDWAKIKGFMKSLLSKLAMKIKWLPNMVSCKRYMVLFCYMQKGEGEIWRIIAGRCDAISTVCLSQLSSTGFLFIHYVQQLEAHCLAHALHLLCQCTSIDVCLIQLGLKEFFFPSPSGWVLLPHTGLCNHIIVSDVSVHGIK